jgi:hypothetical protein
MIIIIVTAVETSNLTCREFENRVLRRIFGPKRVDVKGENCIMSFVIYTHYHVLLG